MKKLRLICAVLCAVMLLSAIVSVGVSAAERYEYKLYDPALDAQKHPEEIAADSVYGQRVILNAPFNGAGFCLPTWNRTDSQSTIGVFEWKGDFDATVKAGAKHELRLETMRDCATNWLRFDEPLPAGEYLFAIYDTVNKVGIWRYPMTKSKGFVYMDGAESQFDLEITVAFTERTDDPVTACESIMQVDGTKKTPPEYVIPDDDVLNTRNAHPGTWVATDGLGRELPTYEQTGGVREGKYVGLFYWSWHNDLAGSPPLNVTEFMEKYPEAKNDYKFREWPTTGTAYFWNEPIYGYYRTVDRWVLRRHAELLANAGVDVIFFDNTNGTFTWRSSYRAIFDVFEQARKDGVMTPKISFLLPFDGSSSNTRVQLESIYMDIYRQDKYQDLWFYWNGKPLLMAGSSCLKSTDLDKEIRKFFTFRPGQPTYNTGDGSTKQWGWLARYPQARYYATAADAKNGEVEEMTVGVAQNSSPDVICTAMNGENIFGRSYTNKDGFAHYEEKDHSLYGYNFAEQWEYALEVDPKFIFVTGWNEWTAGRQETWGGVENAFADEFTDEYSRDIEPTKGRLKDHYYYQFVSYVRKFKGTEPLPAATGEKSIDINGAVSQWDDVGPYYVAYTGNTGDRNARGYGDLQYTDESGNNDIKGAKLCRDAENLYIMIECEGDISPYTDPFWMNVYLDTKQEGLDGWESFDYVLQDADADKITLYRFTGSGYDREKITLCDYTVSGSVMQIKVSRADVGLDKADLTINFKITYGVVLEGDIMNFYTSGDVAPAGRFKYSYTATGTAPAPVTDTDTDSAGESQTDAQTVTDAATGDSGEKTEKKNNTAAVIAIAAGVIIAAAAVTAVVVKKKKH